MNFSKVKLVMILCLIAANVLIGVLCSKLYGERFFVSEEEAELAEKHLSTIGIIAELDRDDRRKYSLPVYACDSISTENEAPRLYKNASEAFFGRTIIDSEYVEIPGGYSVSIMNNEGDAVGSSTFKGSMHFDCVLDGYSETALVDKLSQSFYSGIYAYSEDKRARELADEFVKKAFGKSGLEMKMLATSEYDGGNIVYFGVFLSETPVVDMYVNLFVKDGKVAGLCAELCDTTPEKAYGSDMTDPIDALYNFSYLYGKSNSDADADDCLTVSSIEVMYKMTENDAGGYYFIPVWRIDYIEGSGKNGIALFDAIVGENSYSID